MPSLKRPERLVRIPLEPREALLAGEADVLVVGGGPAGLGAAIGAADAGARVVLAERYGFLGGNATAALVMPLMSFHTQKSVRTEKAGQAVNGLRCRAPRRALGTTSTGTVVVRSTRSVVEPENHFAGAVNPREPITIRSALV